MKRESVADILLSMDSVGKRIQTVRTLAKLTQEQFAAELAAIYANANPPIRPVTRAAVSNWERDLGIKTHNLIAVASTFDLSFGWLSMGDGDPPDRIERGSHNRWHSDQVRPTAQSPLREAMFRQEFGAPGGGVPIGGEVAAGNWLDLQEIDEPKQSDLFVPPHPKVPMRVQRAYIVKGRSIERVAKEGEALLCIMVSESNIAPRDGDIVVAERVREQGGLIERTAKRYRVDASGTVRLYPEYDDISLNKPLEMTTSGSSESQITILAVAIGVYVPLRKI